MTMPTEKERDAYNELTAWTLSLRDGAFIHQHVVDAWAAQHADEDSSAVGVAFALLGLYLHLEKGFSGGEVQRAHMQLAQPYGRGPGRKDWPRFSVSRDRGRVTVCDVMAVPELERAHAIDQWCRSVWDVWKQSYEAVANFARPALAIERK
jgi:Family of unknown function (DUF5946)